jgi:deoxyribonuclease-4
MLLGSHVPREKAIDNARERGAEVLQIFVSAPQTWAAPKPRGDEELLRSCGLPVFVHAPYLANPASLNPDVRLRTRESLRTQSVAAAAVGARGLVVHGGHPTGVGSVEDGIRGWLEVLKELELSTRILIENTAGGNAAVARKFDDFARLLGTLRDAGHDVGVVLDTCHAHAGGEDLEGVVQRLVSFAGAIDLMHVNDSKDTFNSGRDRHEALGKGQCSSEALVAAVAAARCPSVVETPGGTQEQRDDVLWLRQRLQSS